MAESPNSSSSSRMRAASLELLPVSLSTFSISHQANQQEIIVYLRGNADSEVADAFSVYLAQLHDVAMVGKFREVVFDSRELYFLTSACIKSLEVAIKRLLAVDPRLQYKVRLITTPALHWQKRSFEVLTKLAPALVSISPD